MICLLLGSLHNHPSFIIAGFRECGHIEWDGNHKNLHSRLRDTILNREVPIETIIEVNDLLLELEEANKDMADEDEIDADEDTDDGDDDHDDDEDDIVVD